VSWHRWTDGLSILFGSRCLPKKRHKQDRQRTYNVTLRRVLWCLNLLGYPKSHISFQSQKSLLWRFNVDGNNKTCLGLHAKSPIFLPNFHKDSKNFHEVPNIKFHKNPSCGHRADACGTDGQRGRAWRSKQALLATKRTRLNSNGQQRKLQRSYSKMCLGLHANSPIFLPDFHEDSKNFS
jgi:hypothetical protein